MVLKRQPSGFVTHNRTPSNLARVSVTFNYEQISYLKSHTRHLWLASLEFEQIGGVDCIPLDVRHPNRLGQNPRLWHACPSPSAD